MKRQTVRFCDGCGQVFDDIQPEGGQGQWIEARVYPMKYGFYWDDLDRIDDVCPPCARVCQAAAHHPSAAGMTHHVSSRTRGAVQQEICARCHGFMVPSFTDSLLVESTHASSAPAWRCVNCGESIDATIAANRGRVFLPDDLSANHLAPFSRRRWRW